MYLTFNLKKMEQNYKPVPIADKFYISLETYCNYHSKWVSGIFKDWNGDDLVFFRKTDAEDWIETRRAICKVYP